ncbi:putative nucleotide-diphospho-sugar transferase [Salibaculum halophilum]|uniref:putative nucleotide-diphospho-sugar transferase n=1 Tax=Salibaculum halophilum TaxID=1914408 RepID=UPI000A0F8F79|nr:putative nucleotide-diphospho-sugar transferase [Salibaculum halophilum]
MSKTIGAIFATTGKNYTDLAERAAQSLKDSCPGLAVDLFTDQQVNMPVFDRIHQLEDPWRRSKIDAMVASRFDKTLFLDADLFVIADIRDIFDVLDRFDIAMAHDSSRNSVACHSFWSKSLPNTFPQFNSGVVAFRRNAEVTKLLQHWSETVRREEFKRDQSVLRELIWDSDLRVATLPREYNLMRFKVLRLWRTRHAAPRIIHSPRLHKHFTANKSKIGNVECLVGPLIASKLPVMVAADRSLARMAGREPHFPNGREIWIRRLRLVRDIFMHWLRRLL